MQGSEKYASAMIDACFLTPIGTRGESDSTHSKPALGSNTGDSDVSLDSAPSQFLLFRSLEASVTEDLLAKGAAKLCKSEDGKAAQEEEIAKPVDSKVASTASIVQSGATAGSIRRVLLVRDRESDETPPLWVCGICGN